MDRCEARILSLPHDREELEPEVIICPLNKFANGSRNKIDRRHRYGCSTLVDPGGDDWIERP